MTFICKETRKIILRRSEHSGLDPFKKSDELIRGCGAEISSKECCNKPNHLIMNFFGGYLSTTNLDQLISSNKIRTSLNALEFSLIFQFFWNILQPTAFIELLGHSAYLEILIWLLSMRGGIAPPPSKLIMLVISSWYTKIQASMFPRYGQKVCGGWCSDLLKNNFLYMLVY